MKPHPFLPSPVLALVLLVVAANAAPVPARDWLIDPSPYKTRVVEDTSRRELTIGNGLASRVIRLSPDAATTDLRCDVDGEHLLRAVSPEARVTLDGVEYPVGGLSGQKVGNYLKDQWLDALVPTPGAYRFSGWKESPVSERLAWKKRPEWLARDVPWPPPGRQVTLTFLPPDKPAAPLPEVDVHYELYDGLPVFAKWIEVRNTTGRTVRLNRFVSDELRFTEDLVDPDMPDTLQRLWVETDYAFIQSMSGGAADRVVSITNDPDYRTQSKGGPSLLRCAPPKMGPDADIAPGGVFRSFYTFELLPDSTDRERRTLARRRMYRAIAPWTNENPLMFHKVRSDPKSVRDAIDQAAEVGFEMVIMSFGSGFKFESRDKKYWDTYKELADYGRAKGVALGGYSLLASRGAGTPADNTRGEKATFGVMPCLGSKWGRDYLDNISAFTKYAGFGVFENDGSYPGDRCAATDHPFHHGLEDSQWVMWRAITDQYKTLRAEGVFLNVPDWYYLSGANKDAMGYREDNWSLPRAEQEIIERQNMYDGTWTKTQTMGWMFVPLSQYHGGGAAATIEPLKDHLPHYEARLANLLGYGVQACWRGPRLYDDDETKALVKRWVKYYKDHREVLDFGDIIHLRRPNGLDWDGILHVNPQGREKALAFLYNPLTTDIEREVRIPLYYAGLSGSTQMAVDDAPPVPVSLDAGHTATIRVKIPAQGRTRLLFTAK